MEANKAYDLKILLAKLESRGLVIAETAAKELVESMFEWLDESAVLSPNPYDDMARIIYPKIKEAILEQADKISPEV